MLVSPAIAGTMDGGCEVLVIGEGSELIIVGGGQSGTLSPPPGAVALESRLTLPLVLPLLLLVLAV